MKPLVDVARGTEKKIKVSYEQQEKMANQDKITSSSSSREYVAKIKLASSSNRLVIQGAGVKENPRVGAGRTSESRSPSSRVIRTYYESRYGSVSVRPIMNRDTDRCYLSAPSIVTRVRAPARVCARTRRQRNRSLNRRHRLRTEIQYQNKAAAGMVRQAGLPVVKAREA
jgi:hypothetical protein